MPMLADFIAWLETQAIRYHPDADIRPYLTFRIGDRVRLLVVCTSVVQLEECLLRGRQTGLPLILLGGGSNIVFSDQSTEAIVLVNNSSRIRPLSGQKVRVESGVRNSALLSWCVKHRCGGLEFLAGIPGSIGGAAAVNAGSMGRSMAQIVAAARVLDAQGVVREVAGGYFRFGYRESVFKYGREAILELTLQATAENASAIAARIKANIEYRQSRHPSYEKFSAGCFFKNPLVEGQRVSAGRLIEEAGLKGQACGDIVVSENHGNFLLNLGRGGMTDLMKMEQLIVNRVRKKSRVILEREVIYVSANGGKS